MKVKKSSIIEYRERFGTEESCKDYLAEKKWESGYQCIKCGNKSYKKGRKSHDRKCKLCNHNASVTSNTLFHSIKFSLVIAFEMIYRITSSKKGISSVGLCREYGCNPKTAYNFKRKVMKALKSSETNPLQGIVHVDEFVFGGKEEGCQGRSSKSGKLKICIATEIVIDKKGKETLGNAYALSIENYSTKELRKIFEKHIDKSNTKIITDKWRSYLPLKEVFNIEQKESNNGKNFKKLHTLIMNIKSWIRGVHHHISKTHIQEYLNEFFFRFNRRNHIKKIPIFAINNMIAHIPVPTKLTVGGFYG